MVIGLIVLFGMDFSILGEINFCTNVKESSLIGNGDFILSNGFILSYVGFLSVIGMVIFFFFSLSYVMSLI